MRKSWKRKEEQPSEEEEEDVSIRFGTYPPILTYPPKTHTAMGMHWCYLCLLWPSSLQPQPS
ncbi:hypothetical protein Pyn_27417 [Prunus yedoensis var. nudiflora]|uniref:Uncharacterized protein n=1 Tax=Prunus yedoensis var. nudiflora TaxID=2094558 RepID=A0A314XUS1_PRUYE|nr:hypothetical protein Pyn_27417 [Prunus yedoensis var. nudiflora]